MRHLMIATLVALCLALVAGKLVATHPLYATLILGFMAAIVAALPVTINLRKLLAAASARSLTAAPVPTPNGAPDQLSGARLTYFGGMLLSSFLVYRSVAGLTISDLLFFVSLALAAGVLLVKRDVTFNGLPPMLLLGVGTFYFGAVISSFASSAPVESVIIASKFVYLTVFWFWLGQILLTSMRLIVIAVICWTASMALSSLVAIVQFFIGDFVPGSVAFYSRMTGLTEHPNDLGSQAAIALAPSLLFAFFAPIKFRYRLMAMIGVAILGTGMLLSGSLNSSLAAVVIAGLMFMTFARIDGYTMGVGLLSLLALVALAVVVNVLNLPTPLDRLQESIDPQSEYCTTCSRAQTNRLAIDEIMAQPMFGRGLDLASSTLSDGFQVHNILIKAWYEAGLLGLVGISVVLIVVCALSLRCLKAAQSTQEYSIVLALSLSIGVFLILSVNAPMLYQRYAWIPVGLLFACHGLMSHQVGSEETGSAPLPTRQGLVHRRAKEQLMDRWGMESRSLALVHDSSAWIHAYERTKGDRE